MDKSGGYSDYGFVAEFYDHIPVYRNRNDIDFYLSYASETEADILELGCGTGRVLIPIACSGKKITGLDLSEFMLDVCRNKLTDQSNAVKKQVTLCQQNMRNFKFDRKFDLITVPFRAFQHLLKTEDQLSCLQTAYSHLNTGGKLILDLFNPSIPFLADEDFSKESGDEDEFAMMDGRKVMRRFKLTNRDFARQISLCDIIYYVTFPDGHKERLVHSFPIRYLFRYEVEHLLIRVGFEIENIYGDYNKEAFATKYPGELIIVAVKN